MTKTISKDEIKNLAAMLSPVHDRIIVTHQLEDEVRDSGIIIPASARKVTNEGTVVAVGPGRRDENGNLCPMSVKVGDRILWDQDYSTTVKIKEQEFYVLRDVEVYAVINQTY